MSIIDSSSFILRIVVFTRSNYSSNIVFFLFMVAMRAAMLPKMKAVTIAPVMMMSELTTIYVDVLGDISLPTIDKIA